MSEVDRKMRVSVLNVMNLGFKSTIYSVAVLLFLLFSLSACAGYRMGYFSRPYIVGEKPFFGTSSNNANLRRMSKIKLQGLTLKVDLNNKIQTSHTAWAGPVPLLMDLETRSLAGANSKNQFCPVIGVIPEGKDIVFHPELITLVIDGSSFHVTGTSLTQYINRKREVTELSNYPIVIDDLEESYSYDFRVCFETRKPTPDQDIELDLVRAIKVSGEERGKVIRFKKTRYRHGYT